jgi:cysteine-rich secretory family protein
MTTARISRFSLSTVVAAGLLFGFAAPAPAAVPDQPVRLTSTVPATPTARCIAGYIPREAFPGDDICVTPTTHQRALADNAAGPSRIEPGKNGYGPQACKSGYVWREARVSDLVCVTPDVRTQTKYDNSQATSRRPIKKLGKARVPAAQTELMRLVNDARTHPEKYPPNGNAQEATMAACPTPFQVSSSLSGAASRHNTYLATQPIASVNMFPNMHKEPDGKLVWDDGESIDKAGYQTKRAEIVATGFPTAAEAMRFWMQDDAPSKWGHRNNILNCAIREAGGAHLQGGPGNHYWTVDMGTR